MVISFKYQHFHKKKFDEGNEDRHEIQKLQHLLWLMSIEIYHSKISTLMSWQKRFCDNNDGGCYRNMIIVVFLSKLYFVSIGWFNATATYEKFFGWNWGTKKIIDCRKKCTQTPKMSDNKVIVACRYLITMPSRSKNQIDNTINEIEWTRFLFWYIFMTATILQKEYFFHFYLKFSGITWKHI